MNVMLSFVAQATSGTGIDEIKHGYGSLIFTGCFFIALIVGAIWWMKRSV